MPVYLCRRSRGRACNSNLIKNTIISNKSVFIDFHKVFDSVEPQAIWESLKSQGVQPAYIALLQQCYINCTTTITPFHKKIEIPIIRGVRQGDPISPNLKAASLMIQELVEMCGKVGLRMNTNKTKVMRNKFASQRPVNVTLNNVTTRIEEVNEYVYLGRLLNHNNELEPELHRRRRAAWPAFNNIKNTTDALSCPRIRAQLFDSIVLPALTYGSKVWTFTQALSERVRVTHAALERRLVGISLSEQRQRNLHREDITASRKPVRAERCGLAAKSESHSRVTAKSQQRHAPCHSSVARSALTGFREAVISEHNRRSEIPY
uniref:Reverse transcriptase domain-containing protein n=1 Tax=Caenorhabditis japonica TaxID=281687 RepID=A0A8R1ISG9_CAEJA